MKLVVHRAGRNVMTESWRQPETDVTQLSVAELVRRELPGDMPDKTITRRERHKIGKFELLEGLSERKYTPAEIEDTYHPGKYIGGFVFIHALGIFVHRSEINYVENRSEALSPGVIVQKGTKIRGDSHVGRFTELESGVQLSDARVGDGSVVRKNATLREASVGPMAYIGQGMRMYPGVQVGLGYRGGKQTVLEHDVQAGMQNIHGAHTTIRRGAWLGDSVKIAPHSFVGEDVEIGEMFTAGPRLHVGDCAIIGAESGFGSFVRVEKGLHLRSPTFADDGSFISKPSQSPYQYAPIMHERMVSLVS